MADEAPVLDAPLAAEAPIVDASSMVDATPVSSNPTILKMPLEIVMRITSHLTTPELCNWRLASRYCWRAVDVAFIREFFTRKQFMISEHSLQTLVDISKSRLGPYLSQVHIGMDRVPLHADWLMAGAPDKQGRHFELIAAQNALWATGYHRDLLTEAFSHLPNLDTVVIRDFNSTKRIRDGPRYQWKSYGARTVLEETGIEMAQASHMAWPADQHGRYSSHLFLAVLYALGKAGARPRGIEVMSRKRNHLQTFGFQISPFMAPSVLPILANLETLHIDLSLTWNAPGLGHLAPQQSLALELEVIMIRRFLLNCSNLKHLRINENDGYSCNIELLLGWLAQDPNALPPPPPGPDDFTRVATPWVPSPIYPHLEELNLGIMVVQPARLLEVLRKFAGTVKRLKLWKVRLEEPLAAYSSTQDPPKINFWARFLEELKKPPFDLRHIMIGNAAQRWEKREDLPVLFDGKPSMEYTGVNMTHYIGEMIPRVLVDWLDEDEEEDEDGDSSLVEWGVDDGIWDLYALDL